VASRPGRGQDLQVASGVGVVNGSLDLAALEIVQKAFLFDLITVHTATEVAV
jgi:hypothetical protein